MLGCSKHSPLSQKRLLGCSNTPHPPPPPPPPFRSDFFFFFLLLLACLSVREFGDVWGYPYLRVWKIDVYSNFDEGEKKQCLSPVPPPPPPLEKILGTPMHTNDMNIDFTSRRHLSSCPRMCAGVVWRRMVPVYTLMGNIVPMVIMAMQKAAKGSAWWKLLLSNIYLQNSRHKCRKQAFLVIGDFVMYSNFMHTLLTKGCSWQPQRMLEFTRPSNN